ncbi:hypothetical protein ACHQM5_023277 [Ranunculus cassubicifolius]
MEGHSCLSWLQLISNEIIALVLQNSSQMHMPDEIIVDIFSRIDIPEEVIVDIFSRLPADCLVRCGHASPSVRVLITTPSFIEMHLNRTIPVIAFCYQKKGIWKTIVESISIGQVAPLKKGYGIDFVHFTDETGMVVTKDFPFNMRAPIFHDSYDGFLLFEETDRHVGIWNPMTEQRLLVPIRDNYQFCGLFFHPTCKDYRILFTRCDSTFRFRIVGVSSPYIKSVISPHPLRRNKKPIVLSGTLYWMVSDIDYTSVHHVRSDCTDSIVLFDTANEDFRTMPHPGKQCGLETRHKYMELMEMDETLCFCDATLFRYISIWLLNDYDNWLWVKKYKILLEPLMRFCGLPYRPTISIDVSKFYICNKELLLRLSDNDLILYDLQLRTIRRVGDCMKNDQANGKCVVAVPHINTIKKMIIPILSKKGGVLY